MVLPKLLSFVVLVQASADERSLRGATGSGSTTMQAATQWQKQEVAGYCSNDGGSLRYQYWSTNGAATLEQCKSFCDTYATCVGITRGIANGENWCRLHLSGDGEEQSPPPGNTTSWYPYNGGGAIDGVVPSSGKTCFVVQGRPVVNSTNMSFTTRSSTNNDSVLETALGRGTRVPMPPNEQTQRGHQHSGTTMRAPTQWQKQEVDGYCSNDGGSLRYQYWSTNGAATDEQCKSFCDAYATCVGITRGISNGENWCRLHLSGDGQEQSPPPGNTTSWYPYNGGGAIDGVVPSSGKTCFVVQGRPVVNSTNMSLANRSSTLDDLVLVSVPMPPNEYTQRGHQHSGTMMRAPTQWQKQEVAGYCSNDGGSLRYQYWSTNGAATDEQCKSLCDKYATCVGITRGISNGENWCRLHLSGNGEEQSPPPGNTTSWYPYNGGGAIDGVVPSSGKTCFVVRGRPVVNSTNMSFANQSLTHNDSVLESAWGWGTKVICPGFGFSSAACYGTLQTSRPSVIVAWSGGTSTAALGYALHQNSASDFAAWVITHPDYTWAGTAYEFYRTALSGSAFSFLNSKLYIGMGCGAYYYLLHDFASSQDMAKALATSGGESFTGTGRVNGVDLRNCEDNFGYGSAWKGSLGYTTGRYVNVENYLLYSTSTASAVHSLVNAAWSDSAQYSTTQNFQSANCLCTKNGCNFGC